MIFRFKTKATSNVANDASVALAEKNPVDNGVQNEPTQTPVASVASINELSTEAPSDISVAPNAQSGIAPLAGAVAMSGSPEPSADEVRYAVVFARIISVLMRSPHYKHYTLTDLEWLVVPPALLGQCLTMEANVNGRSTPVAVAVWALVSEDVDNRLSASQAIPIRLRPEEWRSGDILWLVDVVGDSSALPTFLRHLHTKVFGGRKVKMKSKVIN